LENAPTQEVPVQEAVQEAQARAEEVVSELETRAQAIWQDAVRFVEENPGTAVGAALLGGIVIGSVLASGARQSGRGETAARQPERALVDAKESLVKTLNDLRGTLDQVIKRVQ
jgi:hypothetical protein